MKRINHYERDGPSQQRLVDGGVCRALTTRDSPSTLLVQRLRSSPRLEVVVACVLPSTGVGQEDSFAADGADTPSSPPVYRCRVDGQYDDIPRQQESSGGLSAPGNRSGWRRRWGNEHTYPTPSRQWSLDERAEIILIFSMGLAPKIRQTRDGFRGGGGLPGPRHCEPWRTRGLQAVIGWVDDSSPLKVELTAKLLSSYLDRVG
ncbi:hypothetical protein F4780DRAFT_732007 [Xylariomycetidae sp. FL0641]|nr:hypothetical protein F4780DRAFT_732007 [Xylariomycetidae sp. FL0641]